MYIRDLNPHLRFAAAIHYEQSYNRKPVRVSDCRIFYVTEGTALLHVADRQYTLQPRSLFFCSAGSRYTISTDQGFSLISLNFDLTPDHREDTIPFPPCTDPAQWQDIRVYSAQVEDSPFLNSYLFLSDASAVERSIQAIATEFSAGGLLFRELCGALLKTILTELHRLQQTSLPPKIAYVKEYIGKHYARNLTNKLLADLVGYHEYYLNRIFTEYTGSSLHEYLLTVRLSRASYLILNTNLELKAIPEQVGFHSYPHFSSYFKQVYGYAPAEYRKRLRGSI